MAASKPHRRRNHQPAARPRPLSLGRAFGFLDIGEDAPGALEIAGPDIGQRHGPRRPLQQPRAEIDDNLAGLLGQTNSFYLATASADGQPYIQHRGGPKGFIKLLDKTTLAFADFSGNRQYITQGNLSENPKSYIFVMDYAHRRRVKIWGEARVVDDDPALMKSLMPKGYEARPEQAIVFKVSAWDTNCPQHIPQKFDAADVAAALAARDARIAELEAEL